MMLVGTCLLGLLPGGYYFFWHRQMGDRPEDRSDATIEDGAGEVADLPRLEHLAVRPRHGRLHARARVRLRDLVLLPGRRPDPHRPGRRDRREPARRPRLSRGRAAAGPAASFSRAGAATPPVPAGSAPPGRSRRPARRRRRGWCPGRARGRRSWTPGRPLNRCHSAMSKGRWNQTAWSRLAMNDGRPRSSGARAEATTPMSEMKVERAGLQRPGPTRSPRPAGPSTGGAARGPRRCSSGAGAARRGWSCQNIRRSGARASAVVGPGGVSSGPGSCQSIPGSGSWNEAVRLKIAMPSWSAVTCRVVNDRPSRVRSTTSSRVGVRAAGPDEVPVQRVRRPLGRDGPARGGRGPGRPPGRRRAGAGPRRGSGRPSGPRPRRAGRGCRPASGGGHRSLAQSGPSRPGRPPPAAGTMGRALAGELGCPLLGRRRARCAGRTARRRPRSGSGSMPGATPTAT